jgi:LacI family transcriptional regulator
MARARKTGRRPARRDKRDPPSIKDVAARARVSIATVSHVLNGTRRVRPDTETRVRTAVSGLGYAPNLMARQLAGRRGQLLGVLVSDIRNPFFPEITTAFQDQALLHDLDAMVMHTNYDAHRTLGAVQRLISLQVPGVAILTSQIDPTIMDLLVGKNICAVYLDLGRVERLISNIVIEYENGIGEALDHLRDLGHERIGFIGGPPQLPSAQRRRRAFAAAAKAAGVDALAVDADFSVKGGYFACAKLLGQVRPTAILAANDLMAIGSMHCAHDRGLDVPRDVSIVGFDDITFAEYTQPSLTTVHVPRSQIGLLAFEALRAMLSDAEPMRAGQEYRLQTGLVVRASTARPPS